MSVVPAADAQTAPSILVLAEHTFFILDLSGHILVQRRLDNHPSCFWPYQAAASTDAAGTKGSNSSSARGSASTSSGGKAPSVVQAGNLLIATHTKALQVYRGQQLAWAAQLELVPVAVRVTSIGGVKGMIVALDDEGMHTSQLRYVSQRCRPVTISCSLCISSQGPMQQVQPGLDEVLDSLFMVQHRAMLACFKPALMLFCSHCLQATCQCCILALSPQSRPLHTRKHGRWITQQWSRSG